jgi:hypothetical protein
VLHSGTAYYWRQSRDGGKWFQLTPHEDSLSIRTLLQHQTSQPTVVARFRVCLYYSQFVYHPALGGIALVVYSKDKSWAMFDFTVLNPCPKTTASHIPYIIHVYIALGLALP